MAKGKLPAKRGGKKDLAVKGSWDQQMAQYAQQAEQTADAVGVGGGGQWLRTKNGEFHFGEDILGETLNVVILDSMLDYAYYPDIYDEDNPKAPSCFAIARVEDDLVPHVESTDPQAATCDGCWADEFGTDIRGRGKACRNKMRLAVIAAGEDGDINPEAEIAFLSLPPTSLKHYTSYVKKLVKVKRLPPMGVVTELSIENNPKGSGFIIKPVLDHDITDPDEQQAILALREQLGDGLDVPYAQPDEEPAPKKRGKKTAKKKAAKKKTAKKAGSKAGTKKKARRKF